MRLNTSCQHWEHNDRKYFLHGGGGGSGGLLLQQRWWLQLLVAMTAQQPSRLKQSFCCSSSIEGNGHEGLFVIRNNIPDHVHACSQSTVVMKPARQVARWQPHRGSCTPACTGSPRNRPETSEFLIKPNQTVGSPKVTWVSKSAFHSTPPKFISQEGT